MLPPDNNIVNFPMVDGEAPTKGRVRKSEQKQEDCHTTNSDDIVADSGDSPGDIDTEDSDNDDSSSSTDVDDFTFDLAAAPSSSEDMIHGWGEMARDGRVPHSEDTSHRLAVCNMDWDRLSANDVFGE